MTEPAQGLKSVLSSLAALTDGSGPIPDVSLVARRRPATILLRAIHVGLEQTATSTKTRAGQTGRTYRCGVRVRPVKADVGDGLYGLPDVPGG